jgi:hypothetical protein
MDFLKLILFSLVGAHSIFVLLAWILDLNNIDESLSGFHSCAVGFSAVLFALKYVLNQTLSSSSSHPQSSILYGLPIPLKYACWAELVIISMVTPNASFVGHLSGILAGILYCHGPQLLQVASRSSSPRYASTISSRRSPAESQSFDVNDEDSQYEYYYVEEEEEEEELASRQEVPGQRSDWEERQRQLSPEELRQQRINRYEQQMARNRIRRK